MPVIDGIEAKRRLKKDSVTVHIPILIVTVVDKKENIVKALEAGAIDYVTKPFFMPELTARVKAVLTLKKDYDENATASAFPVATRLELVDKSRRQVLLQGASIH